MVNLIIFMVKINTLYLQYVVITAVIGVVVTALFFSERFAGSEKFATDPDAIGKIFFVFYSVPIMLSVAIFGWDTPGNGILLAGMFIVATLFWGGVAWLIEFGFRRLLRLVRR